MNKETVKQINQALAFITAGKYEQPEIRPWQYVQMEYERVGMMPPMSMPAFVGRLWDFLYFCAAD